jgi:hypothetical protein
MPTIGDVIYSKNIPGHDPHSCQKYIWKACIVCNEERWVAMRGKFQYTANTCAKCTHRNNRPPRYMGSSHPQWKGGRSARTDGYIYIRIEPDDFFFPMATKNRGYALEHRIILARSLGRNLQPWELVHHKNGIKDDNRIENLELAATIGEHIKAHSKGYRDGYLKGLKDGTNKQLEELRKEVKLVQLQNKFLIEKIGSNPKLF